MKKVKIVAWKPFHEKKNVFWRSCLFWMVQCIGKWRLIWCVSLSLSTKWFVRPLLWINWTLIELIRVFTTINQTTFKFIHVIHDWIMGFYVNIIAVCFLSQSEKSGQEECHGRDLQPEPSGDWNHLCGGSPPAAT